MHLLFSVDSLPVALQVTRPFFFILVIIDILDVLGIDFLIVGTEHLGKLRTCRFSVEIIDQGTLFECQALGLAVKEQGEQNVDHENAQVECIVPPLDALPLALIRRGAHLERNGRNELIKADGDVLDGHEYGQAFAAQCKWDNLCRVRIGQGVE